MFFLGCSTLVVWFLVDNTTVLQLYYFYALGYSNVILFQV